MSLAQGLLLSVVQILQRAARGKEGKSQSLFALCSCSSLVVPRKFSSQCSETRSWFYIERHNYLSSRTLDVLSLIFCIYISVVLWRASGQICRSFFFGFWMYRYPRESFPQANCACGWKPVSSIRFWFSAFHFVHHCFCFVSFEKGLMFFFPRLFLQISTFLSTLYLHVKMCSLFISLYLRIFP